MKRAIPFVFALAALIPASPRPGTAGEAVNAANDPYYCPPGAKFCPAPGTASANVVNLDTHFGMDARTGEVVAYKGNAHPDDIRNPAPAGEQVLYVSPPISVENRYVPYPGSPQTNMVATTNAVYRAQPAVMTRTSAPTNADFVRQDFSGQPQARPTRRGDAASEVANNQASRPDGADKNLASAKVPWWKGGWWRSDDPFESNAREEWTHDGNATEGDKVPWWKGGMWRNRKDDREPDKGSSRSSSGGPSALNASDNMWNDDEYSGYNPDGSFGRQGGSDPYATPSFGGQPRYADPYAAQPYGDPGYAPIPQGASAGYVSEPYPMPNSPAPTSPYPQGYVYPGTDISYDSTFQGGYPQQQPQYTAVSDPYASGPYAAPPPPAPVATQAVRQAVAPEAYSSPEFERAVQMVKENRFTEAKGILSSETSRNPNNAAAWRWLGDCHYNLLELGEAINCYQRALDRDPNDYYALRGQGFSYLHYGHEFWRRMQEEVSRGQKEQAAETFARAHDNYKKSLELLGLCLRRAPNDGEAIYGEAMAAEGASRKLYSNAISYLKLENQRERAELFAENCLTVINKGIERARERARMNPGESGPRALLGGLYLRKAILYNQLGKNDLALMELKNSHDVQQSILDEIDKNNATAQKGVRECDTYWDQWGGNRQL